MAPTLRMAGRLDESIGRMNDGLGSDAHGYVGYGKKWANTGQFFIFP
jgi:hypothetical protein